MEPTVFARIAGSVVEMISVWLAANELMASLQSHINDCWMHSKRNSIRSFRLLVELTSLLLLGHLTHAKKPIITRATALDLKVI